MKIQNTKYKIQNTRKGFTLIELMVAIFIFSLITVAIVSVFVSTVTSYGKARAIKIVKENAEFAMSSIAKDVRMGKIEPITAHSNGSLKQYLMITRNRGGKICYYLDRTDSSYVGVIEGVASDATACPDPSSSTYDKLVDLSGTGMKFDSTAGFYSCPSATSTSATGYYQCPSGTSLRRGWVEINLNIIPAGGISSIDMSTDAINVQTIVSSRDYGWEDVP